jgi:hypothetical protein
MNDASACIDIMDALPMASVIYGTNLQQQTNFRPVPARLQCPGIAKQ